MKRFFTLLLVIIILASNSCKNPESGKQVDEGKIDTNVYTSDELGWTMNIPDDWTIVSSEESSKTTDRGLEAIEETVGGPVDMSQLKNLISFKKNDFNSFQSTSEPFVEAFPGEWNTNNNGVKQIVYNTYINQGIDADSSATSIETIDGLDFKTYSFTIRAKDGTVILSQILYSRFVNGYDFGVNLNYNNEKDKQDMLSAWKNSKFIKR